MTDRFVPDPATYLAVGRLLVALIVLLLVASGLPGDSASPYLPERRQAVGIYQLSGTLDSISEHLDDSGSEELAMGWNDLRNDLDSVIRDLESGRFSVDIDGLVKRVESFRKHYESVEEMNQVADDWDELTRILTDLHTRILTNLEE